MGLVLVRTYRQNECVSVLEGEGDCGVCCSYQWYNCITTLHLVSVRLYNEQSSGAEPRPKVPQHQSPRVLDGEPDMVRLLPNYLVPYRDRSPKTTRKSYGLKSKVHPKIPPTVAFVPLIRGSSAPWFIVVPCMVTSICDIADFAHDN